MMWCEKNDGFCVASFGVMWCEKNDGLCVVSFGVMCFCEKKYWILFCFQLWRKHPCSGEIRQLGHQGEAEAASSCP